SCCRGEARKFSCSRVRRAASHLWHCRGDLERGGVPSDCARLDAAVPSQTPSRCHSKERESQKSEPGVSLESDHEQLALEKMAPNQIHEVILFGAVRLAWR